MPLPIYFYVEQGFTTLSSGTTRRFTYLLLSWTGTTESITLLIINPLTNWIRCQLGLKQKGGTSDVPWLEWIGKYWCRAHVWPTVHREHVRSLCAWGGTCSSHPFSNKSQSMKPCYILFTEGRHVCLRDYPTMIEGTCLSQRLTHHVRGNTCLRD